MNEQMGFPWSRLTEFGSIVGNSEPQEGAEAGDEALVPDRRPDDDAVVAIHSVEPENTESQEVNEILQFFMGRVGRRFVGPVAGWDRRSGLRAHKAGQGVPKRDKKSALADCHYPAAKLLFSCLLYTSTRR